MFKHILASGSDINWMAIFALLTFFFLFVVSVILVFGKSKAYIDKMSNMPLDDSTSYENKGRGK
ncbi:MAG TPA: CcoQ/FixQ family Cbb3-type cytochrome c oxidase assembly chaperone [Bacteroidetes bacterium]|nr:CcoQ/FixQ family Cbb3-type cytochrome c oxidase assembly chaperone [Bacteroidota bacterium]